MTRYHTPRYDRGLQKQGTWRWKQTFHEWGGKKCLDDEEGEESTDTKNEDMIHRDMNENETETNWDIMDKLI